MTAISDAPNSSSPNPNYRFAAALFAGLARAGVGHVCISPGSRSTPLSVCAARQPGLRVSVHVDERSAGFFALGLARASGSPVALVCTSGTAAANYLPAVVEASHARVPLVVLTADRPPELRDWDAGQTIDQIKLYGGYVRWFAELPTPDASPWLERVGAGLAARAVAQACGQGGSPGPVHLNCPLREPLDPVGWTGPGPAAEAAAAPRSAVVYERPLPTASPETVEALAALAAPGTRGVIACGPQAWDPELGAQVEKLARAAGWPVIADPASNLRAGPHAGADSPVVASADFLLRSDRFAADHAPDVVLRLGSTPVSKAVRLWLERHPPQELIVVDPFGGTSDPSQLATRVLAVDPASLCASWARAVGPGQRDEWLSSWRRADGRASRALADVFDADDALHEPRAVRELWQALPDDAVLYVSNSMPIRHLDACMPVDARPVRVLANRGANGIDGMVSSALGAAAADVGPTVLLTGDLALVHDLGGLLAGREGRSPGLSLTIVVLDNDGGGIFSFLPIAAHGESVRFEELFRTPHGLDFAHAARLFGAGYARVESVAHYRAALKDAFSQRSSQAGAGAGVGVSIVHVPCDRDASVAQFRTLGAAVARAAEEGLR